MGGMTPIAAKCMYAGVIGAETLMGGLVPLLLRRFGRSERIMSVANAAAGGLFLSAGLCHMLLDAIRQLGQVWTSKYPLALALCGCGFFGVMFAERICAPQQHQSQEQRECVEIENGSYHAVQRVEPQKNSETDSLLYKPIRGREPGSPAKPLVSSIVLTVALSAHSFIEGLAMGVQDTFGDISATAAAIIAHKWAESGALTIGLMLCLYPQVQAKLKQVSAVSSPQPVPVLSEDIPSSPVVTWSADCACRSHCHNCDDCHRVSADHSVDSVSCVTSDGKKRKLALIVALIVIYSLITPCGVFCGALIDNIVHGSTALYVQGSLNAIASGTFLYISTAELLLESFTVPSDHLLKWVLAFTFFLAMSSICLLD